MRVTSEWSDTEAGTEAQVFWSCIYNGRQDKESLNIRIGKISAVMRALHNSLVMKRELSKKAKLSIFKTVFAPILTYGREPWVLTKRVRSLV